MPVNFDPYFGRENEINNHSTIISDTNYYRVNSLCSLKTLSYLGCKVWEEIPRYLKDQSYLGAFQSGLFVYFNVNQIDVNLTFSFFIKN